MGSRIRNRIKQSFVLKTLFEIVRFRTHKIARCRLMGSFLGYVVEILGVLMTWCDL